MDHPNILFIFADQHRYDCVGVNGHPLLKTPNLDGLAKAGANFSHAFTPIPICIPARCSLLTGQWPAQHGVLGNFDAESFKPLPVDSPTCSAAIRDAGYHTIHVGRWHVDPRRTPHDFGFHDYVPSWRYDKWRAAQGIPPTPGDQGLLGQTDTHIDPEASFPGWSAQEVIHQIERSQNDADPFFLRWHMAEPHLPCRPPEPFASMYSPKAIQPWAGFGDDFKDKPFIQRQMLATWGIEEMTWEDWAPAVARYLGVISLIDWSIGLVLNALDRLGLAENTLVIYSADHGDMCGSHGMIDKHHVMYDDVVRVPLIMRWPEAIPAARVCDDFVSNAIDLAATFCDAAGAPPPETFSGESLLPTARGERKSKRQDMYATYHGNQFGGYSQRMVRDRRWKYIWNATAIDELYDLATDPGELQNRITDPAVGDIVANLRKRVVAWMEKTDDKLLNQWTRRQLLEGASIV